MYNRYIPQSDGTYLRTQINEPAQEVLSPIEETAAPPSQPKLASPPKPVSKPTRQRNSNAFVQRQPNPQRRNSNHGVPVTEFFRQLLPADFDTEDVIVVLLLLLMSGNSAEDQNSALLTLALYLFL